MSIDLRSRAASVLRPLLQFIYPQTCLACEKILGDADQRICFECLSSIRRLSIDDPLYREKRSQLTSRGNISGLASVFHFEKDGTLQHLVHHLKYNEKTDVGVELGKMLGEMLITMLGTVSFNGIAPVPLHPLKKRERGFNQSEFVCKGVRAVTGVRVMPSILRRVRHTRTQTKLNTLERMENVSDAFELNPRYASVVPQSTFLIVDDIITTGATTNECARVLMECGAKKVFAASIGVPDHTHLP